MLTIGMLIASQTDMKHHIPWTMPHFLLLHMVILPVKAYKSNVFPASLFEKCWLH